MEKPDIEQQKLEVEKVKVSIERGKIIEGQIITVDILIVALIGGISTLIVNFDSYQNSDVILVLVIIGAFINSFLLFIAADLWLELERSKERWKKWKI